MGQCNAISCSNGALFDGYLVLPFFLSWRRDFIFLFFLFFFSSPSYFREKSVKIREKCKIEFSRYKFAVRPIAKKVDISISEWMEPSISILFGPELEDYTTLMFKYFRYDTFPKSKNRPVSGDLNPFGI